MRYLRTCHFAFFDCDFYSNLLSYDLWILNEQLLRCSHFPLLPTDLLFSHNFKHGLLISATNAKRLIRQNTGRRREASAEPPLSSSPLHQDLHQFQISVLKHSSSFVFISTFTALFLPISRKTQKQIFLQNPRITSQISQI